jgi:prepilin-type N-terminal cleavage/methylation domain-containing protein/prepilin-type processing-associated H-X9-DG protein
MRRYTVASPRQAGFTLVEVLVAIGIVALLVSVLIPVTSNAIRHAQQATCLSNLREIGTALMVYVSDNEEYFPRASMTAHMGPPAEPFKVAPWGEALAPYILPTAGAGFTAASPNAAFVFGQLFRGVYRCPSDTVHIDDSWVYNANTLYDGHWSYGKNVIFEYNSTGGTWGAPPSWYATSACPCARWGNFSRLTNLHNSSATILFGEIDPEITGGMGDHFMVDQFDPDVSNPANFINPPNPYGPVTVAYTRHGAGSNYIYCDGHAGWAAFADIFSPLCGVDNFAPEAAN